MRRLRLAFAAGALMSAGALAVLWLARAPESRPPASLPSPNGVAPEAAPPPQPEAPAPIAPPRANAPPPSPAPAAAASRADADLIALEEKALRRLDVVALLEAAGIDPRELQRRPDADDVLRHLAGDELLARVYMRLMSGFGGYTQEPPRGEALREARANAEEVIARLSPAERAKYLATALAKPEGPLFEPHYSSHP
jgi:hypothetical protein